MHAVEGEMLCQSTDAKHVPYFNAPSSKLPLSSLSLAPPSTSKVSMY